MISDSLSLLVGITSLHDVSNAATPPSVLSYHMNTPILFTAIEAAVKESEELEQAIEAAKSSNTAKQQHVEQLNAEIKSLETSQLNEMDRVDQQV